MSSLDMMVKHIERGMTVALPVDYAGVSMAMTREMIRHGANDLHLICVPTGGLQVDQLIGAGLVGIVETSAVSLGEAGGAPRFNAAVKDGSIRLMDATCPAIHAGLMAAQKGVPFMPMRGLIGTDLLRHRKDFRVIDNPLVEGRDPIVLVPAIAPDVAVFHAPMVDRFGNVWIGRRRELAAMAYASRITLVTVERIVERNLLADELTAAGVLPALYVTDVGRAPRGAWPYGLWGEYHADAAELARYAQAARTAEGFARYLAQAETETVSWTRVSPREILIYTIAQLLDGIRHVAVGASSPIPAAGAMLLRAMKAARGEPVPRISILGSVEHNFFTNGSAELFDCAAQGRIDAFFLGGGQIDGAGNVNLVGAGGYPQSSVRWPGSFGAAYLYFVVPRVILFREEHSPRVLVEKVDFVSAPGVSEKGVFRSGGPIALLTGKGLFRFDASRPGFLLESVHPGHELEEIKAATGFEFQYADKPRLTALPDASTLDLLRGKVLDELSETYGEFAAKMPAELS